MPRASVDGSAVIDWGVAASALPGQAQSGDLHLVKAVATGSEARMLPGLQPDPEKRYGSARHV